MAQEADDSDECRLVTEIALEKAMDRCEGTEAVKDQIRAMLGLPTGEAFDTDCQALLEAEVEELDMDDRLQLNRWVFCRTFAIYNEAEQASVADSLERAWAEANSEIDGGE
jgi:hypothetical protein